MVSRRARVRADGHALQPLDLGRLGPPAPCRPLADHAQRAPEALLLRPPPQLRGVAGAGLPLRVEPRQVSLKRALADPEHVAALPAQHLADDLAAVAQSTDDLSDGYAGLEQGSDGHVGLLAPQVALVLDALGGGKQRRIDGGGADHLADLPHGETHGVEEATAGVLHQVPAVGDLDGPQAARVLTASGRSAPPRSRVDDLDLTGWPASHACAVAGSRSGSRATIARGRSRSQTRVP